MGGTHLLFERTLPEVWPSTPRLGRLVQGLGVDVDVCPQSGDIDPKPGKPILERADVTLRVDPSEELLRGLGQACVPSGVLPLEVHRVRPAIPYVRDVEQRTGLSLV